MAKSRKLEKCVAEMELHGYTFDEWESHSKWLHFWGEYGDISFESVRELSAWLRGIVWEG